MSMTYGAGVPGSSYSLDSPLSQFTSTEIHPHQANLRFVLTFSLARAFVVVSLWAHSDQDCVATDMVEFSSGRIAEASTEASTLGI